MAPRAGCASLREFSHGFSAMPGEMVLHDGTCNSKSMGARKIAFSLAVNLIIMRADDGVGDVQVF